MFCAEADIWRVKIEKSMTSTMPILAPDSHLAYIRLDEVSILLKSITTAYHEVESLNYCVCSLVWNIYQHVKVHFQVRSL